MKTCLIYNFAQHYRTNVFSVLDNNLDIDFVFGDKYLDVKKMDYTLLSHPVTEVHNIALGPVIWQQNTIRYAFKNYDVFILLGAYLCISSWIIAIIARLRGKKVYFWTHGWYGNEGFCKAVIKKLYYNLATKNLLYGNYARDLMIKQGFDPERLVTIHNSLAYDKQIEQRKKLSISDIYVRHFENNCPNVIFVGRLTSVKKLDILVAAQKKCADMGCFFNVTFIGDGEEKHSLQQIVKDFDLNEKVWFYGPSYDEDELSNLIYNADLCVAPGNIGLTAMHAMVYGCPCISHNDFKWQMPEFEAIKEGLTGEFFERNNVDSLALAIKKWFEVHNSDRDNVRNSCFHEIEEQWNPYKQVEIIKKVIEE